MTKLYGLAWVPISAFNLIEGAAFRQNRDDGSTQAYRTYVVTKVLYRSNNAERVGILARVLGEWEQNQLDDGTYVGEKVAKYDTFSFDFCDTVRLVGLSVNPDSWDDLDVGQVDD
jgi:hypothetical protein